MHFAKMLIVAECSNDLAKSDSRRQIDANATLPLVAI